jgi:hypothetical protein
MAVTNMHPDDAREEAERRLGGTATGAPPTENQKHLNGIITRAAVDFMAVVLQFTPPGRNQAIALTHLEDAKMRAVNAIFQDGDQS